MTDSGFDALSNERCRELLVSLLDSDHRVVPELSDEAREIANSNEELLRKHLASSREVAGVDEDLLGVRLVHLPKIADYGFVEWDRDANVMSRGPRFDDLRPLLEMVDDPREVPPSEIPVMMRRSDGAETEFRR
ncbi:MULTISPECIES: hypothetical protein [Halostella]|uniref:DUF7344 domain-containing protein n=1 Tax=Halostella TaxID=1843185 RepID=UPI001965F258|nr:MULTISPECIES: hypothetical protein [Halostella]